MRLVRLSVVLSVAGCIPALQPVFPTPTVLTNYSVGIVCTAGIGDPIIDVQAARKVPQFVALRAHDPGRIGFTGSPKVQAGQRFRSIGKVKGGAFVIHSPEYDLNRSLVVSPDGRAFGFYDGKGGAAGGSWPKEALFSAAEGLEGQEGAFRAQMIYSGLNGRTIRATYREFSGDFIRPAFAQELQYDLSQDSTIAYKTIKIRVLEATNSQLRYSVQDDGGLPWLPGGSVPAIGRACGQLANSAERA